MTTVELPYNLLKLQEQADTLFAKGGPLEQLKLALLGRGPNTTTFAELGFPPHPKADAETFLKKVVNYSDENVTDMVLSHGGVDVKKATAAVEQLEAFVTHAKGCLAQVTTREEKPLAQAIAK